MKNLKDILESKLSQNTILEKLIINKSSKIKQQVYNYHPKTKVELKKIINKLIEERGIKADLNDIDTSQITDMSWLFYESEFNGDISKWNVSNVESMSSMFAKCCKFDCNLDDWDVKNVKDMSCMFWGSKFNKDISKWNVNDDTNMDRIFYNCPLEKNPPKWYK